MGAEYDWSSYIEELETEVAPLRAYGEARAAHRKAEEWLEEVRWLSLEGTRLSDAEQAVRDTYQAMMTALDNLHDALDRDH